MARIDRILARLHEAPRPVRKSQKLRARVDKMTGKVDFVRPPRRFTGNPWWRSRFADLIERRGLR